MITITGSVHAFYLFDVAHGIDLARLQEMLGAAATVATVHDKGPGPARVKYLQAPVIVGGATLGLGEIAGFQVRVKFYDYGVISLMLSQPFAGAWADLVKRGQDLIENEPLESRAADASRVVVTRVHDALVGPRSTFLDEDYLALVVTDPGEPPSVDRLLQTHGGDIAQMLRGERAPLSDQERDDVLRHRISYLTDDLVVPAYNAAFVYDTEPGALATLEILEYVNSQLLEFRFYDELLESELGRIYGGLQRERGGGRFFGRRSTKAVNRMHALYIDVNELTDRMENVLKLVGDIYAARLFGLAGARLGLDAWKRNVEDKLETLAGIHRFTVEQTNMLRANLLELAIVLILVIEFGFFIADLVRT